jgi:hypothetical protein
MIRIYAFRAIDNEAECLEYASCHKKVLERFNLGNISTNNVEWAYNEQVYVLVARSEITGNMLGGIRIQLADGKIALPVENAVSHFDPKVHDLVELYRHQGGTAELCGLWNSREESPNVGITLNLVLAGLAICNQLPITSMFTIVASYTLKITLQVGFAIEKQVGNNGEFVYPNSNYVAKVLTMNPQTLEKTYQIYKEKIINMRQNTSISREEITPKGQHVVFNHNLNLSHEKIIPS